MWPTFSTESSLAGNPINIGLATASDTQMTKRRPTWSNSNANLARPTGKDDDLAHGCTSILSEKGILRYSGLRHILTSGLLRANIVFFVIRSSYLLSGVSALFELGPLSF